MGAGAVRLSDQGCFWVGVAYEPRGADTITDGTQLYVEYQVPEEQTQPYPVVLIHGGGGQATDWMSTPDGRPGWRTLLLQKGYAVYLVDRPGHGRSPRTIDEPTAPGPLPSVEGLGARFSGRDDPDHTQWPGDGGAEDTALGQWLASQRQPWFDLARDHALMRERGAQLLDRIGPAIIVTNSAGGPAGWLMADARPHLVRAIAALEPLGPSGPMPLAFGLAAAPMSYEPPVPRGGIELVDAQVDGAPARLQSDPPRRLPHLADLPIAIVTAERSFAGAMDVGTVAYLQQAGCGRVEHLRLAEHGVHGNGHLAMIERNNAAVLDVVLAWVEDSVAIHSGASGS